MRTKYEIEWKDAEDQKTKLWNCWMLSTPVIENGAVYLIASTNIYNRLNNEWKNRMLDHSNILFAHLEI